MNSPNMPRHFVFQGEESARFAKLAKGCADAGIGDVRVTAEGREPLTSRQLTIQGILRGSELDGYIRYITVDEDETGIALNIGGSNSTRSVAARRVTFELTEEQLARLTTWAIGAGAFIPLVSVAGVPNSQDYSTCEAALIDQSVGNIRAVLTLFDSADANVRTEAALTVRGLAKTIKTNRKLHQDAEHALIELGKREANRDALVAALEDLGYLGEDDSKAFLSEVISNTQEDQARWAATIAISRLVGDAEVWRPLLTALSSPQPWVQRAALLSLARRATVENQSEFEPTFARFVLSEDDLLRRYACLGLSRFKKLEDATWASLIILLSDDKVPFGTKGYAALTISGAYPGAAPDLRETIVTILGTMPGRDDLATVEMDSVWSLEFLGELASISGQPQVAARLYKALARLFTDWREQYYLAISAYELGEAEASQTDGEDAITKFSEAERKLSFPTDSLLDHAVATIEFRREIVTARRRLQGLVLRWRDTTDAERLSRLAEDALSIEGQYRRYTDVNALGGRERQLVQREIEYLRTTASFMELLSLLLRLDARVRSVTTPESDSQIELLLANAEELVGDISGRLNSIFSLPLQQLLGKVKEYLALCREALGTNIAFSDKLKNLRNYIRRVCAAFWGSSWPMPGRACPVYGLGRATTGLRPGAYKGRGTFSDPLVFEHNATPILPLYVRILDMATGGNAELVVRYSVGEHTREVPVHAVEDEYPIPIDLRQYADASELAVDVRAIFRTRDCIQEANRATYYVRTKPWT